MCMIKSAPDPRPEAWRSAVPIHACEGRPAATGSEALTGELVCSVVTGELVCSVGKPSPDERNGARLVFDWHTITIRL